MVLLVCLFKKKVFQAVVGLARRVKYKFPEEKKNNNNKKPMAMK